MKSTTVKCNIEPMLDDLFGRLCQKRGLSKSSYIRSMIIDELRLQGLLTDDYIALLYKGVGVHA